MTYDPEIEDGMAILTAREERRVTHRTETRIGDRAVYVTVEIEGYEPSEVVGILATLVDDVERTEVPYES